MWSCKHCFFFLFFFGVSKIKFYGLVDGLGWHQFRKQKTPLGLIGSEGFVSGPFERAQDDVVLKGG